jgi:peptidoglycan/xylan/chitin deacetylase (PgdA/CDA1 family)
MQQKKNSNGEQDKAVTTRCLPVRMSTTTKRSRWILKKTARAMMASTSLGSLTNNREPSVRALTYHRFGDIPRDPFCVSVRDFDRQMSYIAKHDLAVSLQDVEAFIAGKKRIPPGSLLITIDDGFRSTCLDALPVLEHYAIPAVAFICPGLIDDSSATSQGNCPPEPYISWDEVQLLQERGITIGSHSMTHRSIARISSEQAHQEAALSRQALQQRIGEPVSTFAYPFGTRADFNSSTANLVRDAGYTCAFTSQHGAIKAGGDAYALPRVKVEGGEGLWLFKRIAHGGLDAWRWIDRALWRIQSSSE